MRMRIYHEKLSDIKKINAGRTLTVRNKKQQKVQITCCSFAKQSRLMTTMEDFQKRPEITVDTMVSEQ